MSANHNIQVAIKQLGDCYNCLGQILSNEGLNAIQLNEVFQNAVTMECALCHFPINLEEVSLLAVGGAETIEPNSKLQCLHLGNCPRGGCVSKYALLRCSDFGEINWENVLHDCSNLIAKGGFESDERSTSESSGNSRIWLNIASIVLFLIACGISWNIYKGESEVVLKPKHKFSIDPKSFGGNK